MPWGDGTGPWGLGPMTGRAAGYCAGYPVPGYMNPIPGFGWRGWFGRGRWFFGRGFWGRGRGWWRGIPPIPLYVPPVYYRPYYYNPYYSPYYSLYSSASAQQDKETERKYLEGMLKELDEEIKAIKERLSELSKGD